MASPWGHARGRGHGARAPRTSFWKTVVDPLDTSSLVKLYVEEPGSLETERLVGQASLICTSVIAYAEARSALARLCREGGLTAEEHTKTKADLDLDWPHYLAVEVVPEVWRYAGDLAEKHALRGFDSLHLASFLYLVKAGLGEPVEFSSFDDRLNGAARLEIESPQEVLQGLSDEVEITDYH